MGWLEGQVALVTGGGSGLGRAIVERFLDEGAKVGVLEINPDKAQTLAADLGESVLAVQGDVTSMADNERAVAETVAKFGKLDTFVGNAALWDFGTSAEAMPSETVSSAFDQVFGVNVKGYLMGAKASAAALRDSKGSIIFTVSNAGFYPGGGGPLYTSSKHAVMGLVKQLAYELSPDVRVNGVAPGGMATDLRGPAALGLSDTSFGDVLSEEILEKFSPLDIIPKPEDYTGHYVLLASAENSRTTTGSVHNCDGGMGVRGRRESEALMSSLMSPD
ncbi:MAG: 3-(cis-5,6-dihydroxycyclohexa-1,3-dien-1-yl)propanoate dehydrogenase [Ilumatobacteraceae bacterium]|nr:3-(cis-5,6-dihydroxycyclohexa-1,3-dien-1-yl)propanoate dehydrogenase [Ilumatobacteraceae bacterium]